MGKKVRIAVEVGGTFTDVIMMTEGVGGCVVRTLKVLSTPKEPEKSVLEAFRQLGVPVRDLDEFLHGSTVATNTVIERKGARAALLTTQGFRDLLEIQRGDKTSIYTLQYRRPEPLIPRDRCLEVRERMSAKGEIVIPLDEEAVARTADKLKELDVQSVAISLLNSFANPEHEQRVARIVKAVLPGVPVSVSSELLPQFREYERTSTTVINAYVCPVVDRYLGRLEEELRSNGFRGSFLIMQSNGGIMPAEAARRRAAWMLLSGPAAGVVAAIAVARTAGLRNIITFDMGGTSTDVCLVSNSKPQISTEGKVGGLALGIPTLEIVSVGAGGGSIAWQDQGGLLRVGPQSAGADPGPACYGRGGVEPTVTDAQVIRGLIRETQFIGGKFLLKRDLARKAIERLGRRLGLDERQTAESIVRIANNNMLQAIRVVSAERGYDPRDYVLVAFGGAGPLHAAEMAGELGIQKVLIPRNAGLFSALGLLLSDFKRDYVQTRVRAVSALSRDDIAGEFCVLEKRAEQEFAEYGISTDDIEFAYSLDMRFQGQAFEILVDVPSPSQDANTLRQQFERAYMTRYGYVPVGQEVEVVTFRVTACSVREVSPDVFGYSAYPASATANVRGKDTIFCGGSSTTCAFYPRSALREGDFIEGPSVVEEDNSACYIPQGWVGTVDHLGSLILERRKHE